MLKLLSETTIDRAAAPAAPLEPWRDVVAAPRALRILSFDIENRPLSYWYDGKCTAEVTAIACKFIDGAGMCACLGEVSMEAMLEGFRTWYDSADIVTGHYILGHDLGIINAMMVECDLPLLGPKLVSDTRKHLVKFSEIAKSQEALGALRVFKMKRSKEHMTQSDWREANRLTPEGIAETRRRVVGDVEQHIELRARLVERGYLKPPTMWSPGGVRVAA